jgi:nickel-dependent lactate racemase
MVGATPTATTAASARIRWSAWFDDTELELDFPPAWTVTIHPPHDGDDIGEVGIAAALSRPIGTPTIRELATGRRAPCIVVDDLTRPTQGRRLLPPILDELAAAGIAAEDVLVLAGVANHRPMVTEDLVKKVGTMVLERCQVANHFSWDGCTAIGTTTRGTPVELNDRFLASDLRILVGSIIPHGGAGFSGGAKLLMPGVASIRSAQAFHTGPVRSGRYAVVETESRLDAEEAARMADVDCIVNSVPTSSMGVAALVVGDVVEAHRAGVDAARRVMSTDTPVDVDICVLSLYPKDGEFLQHLTALAPYLTASEPVVRKGGTVVIALAGAEGVGFHSLFGPGMAMAAPRATRLRDRDLIFFAPGVSTGTLPPNVAEETVLHHTWEATVEWLQRKHGTAARVAVFPCATMQLSSDVC